MNLLEKILLKTAKISVVGLGYIGLPTSLILAESGFTVYGVDVNKEIVESVNKGKTSIKEQGLKKLLTRNLREKKLSAGTEYKKADVFIICVPTPAKENRSDLSYVISAGKSLARILERDNLVILESTVPPGTTEEVLVPLLQRSGRDYDIDFFVAYCPERAFPGDIVKELMYNDRIVGGTKKSVEMGAELYRSFVKGNIYTADAKTAEMIKLMENTYRDVNIALANEFALACETLGINFFRARKLANKHPRVNIHLAGSGTGGHCMPLDPWFIYEKFPDAKMIPVARVVNKYMPVHLAEMAQREKCCNVVIFGRAYKKNVRDTRESPAFTLMNELEKMKISYTVYDPVVGENEFNPANKDGIIIVTDHDCFKTLDWEDIRKKMKRPLIIDGRNFFEKGYAEKMGFSYTGVGK